ncbi:MAG: 3'(2'),5'-bisphosphate nucleotidase CysQ [Rhodospirillaceae bacterium]|jgi:3'(2'), 5'-bisphosphate nucleotidase|nr:3'(2'),5'-bisphosphate nucleotidase CysQ [Rhodospirillaceae bacterium]
MSASLTDQDISRYLDLITPLAEQAGAEIMTYYKGDMDVRTKSDSSPVTAADEAAEKIIIAGLHEIAPHIPVVAEEAMAGGATPDVSGGLFWLVDPLDGTKEFVSHRDEFTVNIALVEDGVPILGVVTAPALDVVYTGAGPGTAMMRRGDGTAEPISARKQPASGAVVTASRSHSDMKKIQELMNQQSINDLKISGSSVKFCLVAEGVADIYPRYGPTREWDTAAGHAVLLAAGGSVRTLDGEEMLYGKAHFLNTEFIARGRDA